MSSYVETTSKQTLDNSFWSILKEAVRGSNRDFTQGSIGLAIFLLSVPMILEMIMESLFAIVDIFFVAHLGAEAVAVVGITEAMMAIVYAVAFGLAVGATATVARRVGEKDMKKAAKAAAHVLYLGFIVSIVMSIVGIIFAPTFLRLLGAEPQVVEQGTTFTRIMLGGNAVVVFIFLLNAIFRGAGDAAVAMRVLWLANALNIVLAPCFIYGNEIFAFFGINAPQWLLDNWIFPKLGVTGAAVGTTIGRGVGVLYAAWCLFRPSGRITIHREDWTFDFDLLWRLVKLSSTAVLQFTIGTASWSALVRVIAGFGSAAIAGYVIGLRVIVFALLPALGLSNAAATLVGQNLGAKKPERAERAVWTAAFFNAAFYGVIGLIFFLFPNQIIGIFTDDPTVFAYGTDCLRIVAYGFAFYGLGMVLETAFNGAGDARTPTFINLFIFWLFEIPLAYVLAYYYGLGAHGVFWAITIAFSALAIVSALLFRHGRWKEKVI
ncbi:MAG TPA: MATE family efflux transporter [Pyrinomonadaceae bacterium]|nr:MATE family efflux transporter [Pyrinomonadaceae bacterium]